MAAPQPRVFYVLVCRQCDGANDPAPMPFDSEDERSKWATDHTLGTGHDQWFVFDQPDTPNPPAVP